MVTSLDGVMKKYWTTDCYRLLAEKRQNNGEQGETCSDKIIHAKLMSEQSALCQSITNDNRIRIPRCHGNDARLWLNDTINYIFLGPKADG